MSAFEEFSRELTQLRAGGVAGLVILETIHSTHQLARRIIDDYCQDGSQPPDCDLFAWQQTAGRGRAGNPWLSLPGAGIYTTLIRRFADRRQLQIVPMAVGVALCEVLRDLLSGRCRLKWPNDLYVGKRKLGGILLETCGQTGDKPWPTAVGIGINYGASRELQRAQPRAVALQDLLPPADLPSMARLAWQLISAVDSALGDIQRADLVDRYQRLSLHRPGDALRCRVGGETVEGTLLGFDAHGFLRLEAAGEERRLASGDILLADTPA